MPGTKTTIGYEITGANVLPEVLAILDEMIRLYNDFEAPCTYLKLNGPLTNTFKSRYEMFSSKEALLTAIKSNCPAGCTLTNV
jgi:hypothetical protein